MAAECIINELKEVAADLNREKLSGIAAKAAENVLLLSWEDTLLDDYQTRLLSDVDEVITHLREFKERARALLPVTYGGFAGVEKGVWLERLASAGVLLYEVPESGSWGFTNCECDCYADDDEALNAAIQSCFAAEEDA